MGTSRSQRTPTGAASAGVSQETTAGRRLLSIRVFVVGAVFTLMVASAVTYGTDLVFDLAVATVWTATFALVWEVGARALARLQPTKRHRVSDVARSEHETEWLIRVARATPLRDAHAPVD